MNAENYSILIVDDHPIVSNGLATLIGKQENAVCTTANTLNELESLLVSKSFDLCIMDMELPETNGFELIHLLHKRMPTCNILIYTMHEEPWIAAKLQEPYIHQLLSGAISKHATAEEICTAIRTIQNGKTYFGKPFSALPAQTADIHRKRFWALSEREKKVFAYLTEGLSTTEIAQRMYLSVNTIQTYRARLLDKMDAKNVAELVCKGKWLL